MFWPTSDQIQSITEDETWELMTTTQRQRVTARRRQAELFHTESVAMREKGLNAQAKILEQDAQRYDGLASKLHHDLARKIARERYAPKN